MIRAKDSILIVSTRYVHAAELSHLMILALLMGFPLISPHRRWTTALYLLKVRRPAGFSA